MNRQILIGILIIFLVWIVVYYSGIVSPALLASPFAAMAKVVTLLLSGDLLEDIRLTGYRWLFGYVGGVVTGIPIGLFMGTSPLVAQLLEFPVDFFRSLPVTSLFPLFLLAFGIGDESKIAMVWVAVFFILVINSAYGAAQASKQKIQMAKTFGASNWQTFKDIIAWEAVPQIFVGMRIGLSTSLIVVIVSEMFMGTQYGLGQRVFDAYSKNVVDELYGVLILTGMAGYLLNKLFVLIERKVLFWVG